MRIIDLPQYQKKGTPLTCNENASVYEAVEKMAEKNYGAILITNDDGVLTGIFTERDLMRRVAAGKCDMITMPIKDVMTRELNLARLEDSVAESLRRMSEGRFRHMPIVDENGRPTGLVSQGDFVAFTWPQLFYRLTQHTKASFLENTQLWMIVFAIMIYTIILLVAFRLI